MKKGLHKVSLRYFLHIQTIMAYPAGMQNDDDVYETDS